MRKLKLFLCITLAVVLSACGKPAGDNTSNTPVPTTATENNGNTLEATKAPEETVANTEATKAPEQTGDSTGEKTEATAAPTQAAGDNSDSGATEVWVMKEAPVIRNSFSEEEKLARQTAILEKGTFLFSDKTNKGYYPGDISWLTGASEKDAVALIFACDDVTHGGWGVLGLSVKSAKGGNKQKDIAAYSDQPQKERLVVYTMEELLAQAKAEKPADITSFQLGAWNGGRIAGLYYLPEAVATELSNYLAEVEKAEQIIHTYNGELSNENAIENAKIVYDYLKEVYGKVCLTGQMESTWMGSPDYELNYIENATGKLPAIRGLDFMHNDFAGVTKRAKEWWEKGGIPTICWHTGSDFASGYDESKAHNLNWEEAFVPGTETYNKLLEDMDRAVPYLQQLEDAGVPILWRPFHELDGGWFWWSKGGAENFVKLWQLMYSRYTDFWGLNNLIWVFGYSGNGGNMAAWYPGDSYVDLLGADSYTPGANVNLFEECDALAPEGMPLVFHECGTIPTEAQMAKGAPWSFFMVWHTDYITNEKNNSKASLNEIYNSEYFITLDELPFLKAEQEVSYMEKYQDLVVVKPEESIYKEQSSVEYGEFKKYTYYSTTAERDTNVNVLLPPGYSEEKEYPVLYILHGFWDNEEWMARPVVSLSTMLSNLYASGEAKEMIVVLPYIYCSKDMPYCTGMDLTNSLNYDNFINDLTTDLMPFIEKTFSVAKGRENTAITGFSMGGRESLFIGFSHPELFGYIGAACPAPGLTKIANSAMHPGQMTGDEMVFTEELAPYLLFMSASKADGVVGTNPKTYHNVMTKNGTEHIWHELTDTGHDHTSVKPHLYNFLRLIFKDGTTEAAENTQVDENKTYVITVETIVIKEGEKEIYGKLYRPMEEGNYPAVILSHGYNGIHADFVNECRYFATNGYVAYTFDFSGGSTRSKSKGKSTDMTIFTEKEDLITVFNYIKELEIVDKDRVFLFGGSQGGLVTAMAAEEYVDEIKGLILYFPAFNIPDDWRKNYRTEANIPKTVDFWGLNLGENFFKSMREFYTFENIGKFDRDILIIHGDKDTIAPLRYSKKAQEHYKSVELVVLEGEGHGFTPKGNKAAMELALEFMKEHK